MKNTYMAKGALVLLLTLWGAVLQAQTTYYVKSDATGNNSGTSWANAYADLQDALTSVGNGDTIWVAAGTYYPTSTTERTASFMIFSGTVVYGGFTGSELALEERNTIANPTILSGDIGTLNYVEDNSYHVVRFDDTNGFNVTVLDGFIIESGNANGGFDDDKGGGILTAPFAKVYNEIRNCIIRDNVAINGGGIAMTAGFYDPDYGDPTSEISTTIINCVFDGNTADFGGGVYCEARAYNVYMDYTVSGSTFVNNSANQPFGGGAIYNGVTVESSPQGDFGEIPIQMQVSYANSIFQNNLAGGVLQSVYANLGFGNADLYWQTTYSIFDDAILVTGVPMGAVSVQSNTNAQIGTDYILNAASPAIDAGNSAYNFSQNDIYGESSFRVQGSETDMGAFEYKVGAPTLSAISNQEILVGSSITDLPFTLSDDQDPSNITLSVTSSNTTLVPNANITLGGSGADRTISIVPANGVTGTSTIIITARDQGVDGIAGNSDDMWASEVFVVTVNYLNNAPSFTGGPNQGLLEDAGAQNIAGWATNIDDGNAESNQSLWFEVSNDNNALFLVEPAINASTGNLTFTPAANANGLATVTVNLKDDGGTANGGSDTSVEYQFTITVTAVNDAPTFTIPTTGPTINEDAGAQDIAWATNINDGDPEPGINQTLTFNITANTNETLFSAPPAIGETGILTYTPAENANGAATITVTLSDDGGTANGGVDTSIGHEFTITITPINDAPSFTAGDDQTVDEDAGAQTVDWATDINDGDPEAGINQTLTFNITANSNEALFSTQPSIDGTGKLTYTPAENANGAATITVTLSDDGGTANGGVDTSIGHEFTITITPINDAPSFTAGDDQTVDEDAGAQTVDWATDINDGDPEPGINQKLTFNIIANTNQGLFSEQPVIDETGKLTYTPAVNAHGAADITVTLSDDGGTANGGVDTGPNQQFTITVAPINDAPSFTAGNDQTVTEDAEAQIVEGWAKDMNDGDPEIDQELLFIVSNDKNEFFSEQPAIDVATGNLTYTLAPNASGLVKLTVVLSEKVETINSGAKNFTIFIEPINDAPSFTLGTDQTINEDAGAQSVSGWATDINDGDPEADQTLTFNITANTNQELFTMQPAIDATGKLTFTPAENASGVAEITINLKDNGGTTNGGVDTSIEEVFRITVNAVNDAPVALGAIQDQEAEGDVDFSFILPDNIFDDVEEGESGLTLSAALSNGSVLPTWLSFDAAQKKFSGKPQNSDEGTIEIAVKATDSEGAFAQHLFSIVVNKNHVTGLGNSLGSIVSLYPNPSADKVIVELGAYSAKGTLDYSIFDLEGKMIVSDTIKKNEKNTYEIDLSPIRSGKYVLRFSNGTEAFVRTIIKE